MSEETFNRLTLEKETINTIKAPFVPDEEQPYIFISYAHTDRDRVFPIIKELYEIGYHIWYDEGIPVGNETDYLDSLAKHIKNCHVILVFVSETSVESDFVINKELIYGIIKEKKRAVFYQLDRVAELPDRIELAAADEERYPRTDENGILSVLGSIEGLTRFDSRKAIGFQIKKDIDVAVAGEEDEYDFRQLGNNEVVLTKYNGTAADVIIPETYLGQIVVKLDHTFEQNKYVRTVRVPPTVRDLGEMTFSFAINLQDVYIPSSVKKMSTGYFDNPFSFTNCTIHCWENTVVHRLAESRRSVHKQEYIIDPDMNVDSVKITDTEHSLTGTYAYCSFADDKREDAQQIISQLAKYNCSVISSDKMDSDEKLTAFTNASHVVVLASQGYIENEINYLRLLTGSSIKKYIILDLENYAMPDDINVKISAQQRIPCDNGTDSGLPKLVNWLKDNGCVIPSLDILDFEYTTNTDGGIILTKYTGNKTEVVIPNEQAGHPVVGLNGTFLQRNNLTSVIIPDGVKSIGDDVFCWCSVTSVSIPNSVTSIGNNAFNKCSITSICIPNSVTSIGDYAFFGCLGLTSIDIPDSVANIGNGAFSLCERLKEINISNRNNDYISLNGVVFSKDKKIIVAYPAGNESEYIIPDGVTTIADSAFYGCRNLISVSIPSSVTTISDYAFRNCQNLTSVTIPDGVTYIGECQFYGCRSLTSVSIPNSVTIIDESAFDGCLNLSSVIIPNRVTRIGYKAFSRCNELTVFCTEDSAAWFYCEENHIPHKSIEQYLEVSSEGTTTSEITEPITVPSHLNEASSVLKEPSAVDVVTTKASHHSLAPLFILFALLVAAVGITSAVQLSGTFDIIGWLLELFS